MGVFHKSIGDAMKIDFSPLPSGSTGFRDGLHFLEEVDAWREQYEMDHMVPNEKNHRTANETTELLLMSLPGFMKGIGFNIVKAVMDARLRKAMMYTNPPPIYPIILSAVFALRKFFLRYLALPRPAFLRVRSVTDIPDAQGRRHLVNYDNFPYYVKPTLMNRWGPGAWVSWLNGRPLPGDEGYFPEGFKSSEVGPNIFRGKGGKEAEVTMSRLRKERTSGCPFMMVR